MSLEALRGPSPDPWSLLQFGAQFLDGSESPAADGLTAGPGLLRDLGDDLLLFLVLPRRSSLRGLIKLSPS